MNQIREKLRRFMAGRYGNDDLGRVTIYASLAFLILSMFVRHTILYTVALLLLAVSYFRMFSRNHAKRYQENQKFVGLKYKITRKFNGFKQNMKDRKTHHIYKCPSCRQKVRVPKGKGKISIRCPKCSGEFIKNS